MRFTTLFVIILIAGCIPGCMSMGIQSMTEGQIKATAGMITCTKLATAYGQGISTTVNADDVRKGATNKSEITMTPDCAITIKTDVGVAPVPVKAAP